MKKITQLTFWATFLFAILVANAQTPKWYRENTLINNTQDSNVIATDASGNIYNAIRYQGDGELLVVKLDTNGNILWNTHFPDSFQTNPNGAVILNNGGTDYLYVSFDSQTAINGQQQIGLACLDITNGTTQWFYSYVQSGTSRNTHDLSVASDGSLMITADDIILFLDKDGTELSQYGPNAITFVRTAADLTNVTSLTLNDTNTETDMPFDIGSPLANTPSPTGSVFNGEKDFIFGTTHSQNNPANNDAANYDISSLAYDNAQATGGSSQAMRASILNDDGFYIYHTTTLGGYSHQAIIKINKTDKSTVEWAYTWRQSAEKGAILDDENGNIYVITWDQSYFLNSGNLDILINKFDKNGNHQWSKVYGNGTGSGNEVIWRSSSVAIDKTNGRILINAYTDSFNTGVPNAAMLVINYDGELQNYTIVGSDTKSFIPISIAFDANGNMFGTGQGASNAEAIIYKVNADTVFDESLSSKTIDGADTINVIVKENGSSLQLQGATLPNVNISLYTITGQELFNDNIYNNIITGLNLQHNQIYLLNYQSENGSHTIKFSF